MVGVYEVILVGAKGELRRESAPCVGVQGGPDGAPSTRASSARSPIVGMVNVADRPADAEDRAIPGHWEGDLIIGEGGKSVVATLVERTMCMGMS